MLVQQVFDHDQAHGHHHYINIKLPPQNHIKKMVAKQNIPKEEMPDSK